MARNPTKIAADLKKAAQRVAQLRWRKPIVIERVKRVGGERAAPKGFSVRRMFRAAPEPVIRKAEEHDVRVIRRRKRVARGQLSYMFETATSENGLSRRHIQTIKVKDKAAKLEASQDLYYECDCGFFRYYCDYAMWKKGASELKHSIDEPPVEKNPRMTVYPCKHLYIVCESVLSEHI